jgi:hypothetical protein
MTSRKDGSPLDPAKRRSASMVTDVEKNRTSTSMVSEARPTIFPVSNS